MCDRWSALSSFPLEQSGKRMRTTSCSPLEHRLGGDVAHLPGKHLQVTCEVWLVTTFSPGGGGLHLLGSLVSSPIVEEGIAGLEGTRTPLHGRHPVGCLVGGIEARGGGGRPQALVGGSVVSGAVAKVVVAVGRAALCGKDDGVVVLTVAKVAADDKARVGGGGLLGGDDGCLPPHKRCHAGGRYRHPQDQHEWQVHLPPSTLAASFHLSPFLG